MSGLAMNFRVLTIGVVSLIITLISWVALKGIYYRPNQGKMEEKIHG
jgi:hypothetical protein